MSLGGNERTLFQFHMLAALSAWLSTALALHPRLSLLPPLQPRSPPCINHLPNLKKKEKKPRKKTLNGCSSFFMAALKGLFFFFFTGAEWRRGATCWLISIRHLSASDGLEEIRSPGVYNENNKSPRLAERRCTSLVGPRVVLEVRQ